jgi:hypothetical protein
MKRNKIIRYLLLLVLAGVVIGGGIGYYIYNKPHRDIEHAMPDYILTADELTAAYADEAEGNKKFLNNVVLLVGEIEDLSRDAGGNINVLFSTPDGEIDASLDDRYQQDEDYVKVASQIESGKNIQLQCYCSGAIKDTMLGIVTSRIVLKNCFIKKNKK